MNVLAVQNPRHKRDLGNKNDSVTDKKITTDIINTHVIITIIIIILRLYYICVCITTYTPSATSIRLEVQC